MKSTQVTLTYLIAGAESKEVALKALDEVIGDTPDGVTLEHVAALTFETTSLTDGYQLKSQT